MNVNRACIVCKKNFTVAVDIDGYERWVNGGLIQNELPGLTPDERELLITGYCGACFDELFRED